jgi:pimeloyl-ACP methyl ester carboxylesterase
MKIKLIFLLGFVFTVSLNAQIKSIEGEWEGKIVKDGKAWSVELNIYQTKEELTGTFNLPDYGLYNLTFKTVSIKDTVAYFFFVDRNSKATFDGTLKGNMISGNWEGLGMKAVFSIQKKSSAPRRFDSEDITFSNADATLSGTLILPVGKGPFPAIVQIHGSGNQTRSEDFYRSRAYLFAQHGIAVLIYDRRGKGQSTGTSVSMELLADDAIAGVNKLKSNPRIEKTKIGIMGFSQGGYVGPLAASRSSDIAFLIVGSAPGITPDEQNDFDVENALRNRKVSEDTIRYVLAFRKDLRNYQYSNLGDKAELESRLAAISSKTWFRNTLLADASVGPANVGVKEWLSFNPLPIWKKVRIPKLLVWGKLDTVVPALKSKELIEEAFKQATDKNYLIKVYDNSGHGISVINDGSNWDWPRLADGYNELLISWTKQALKE